MKFTFEELARAAGGTLLHAKPDGVVTAVSTDSRNIPPNSLFLAVPGERFDGHDFLGKALESGAALLCAERKSASKIPEGAPVLLVDSTVEAYQKIAHFHRMGFPELKVVALTGSCGKTSTKEMLRAIFAEAFGKEHVLATEGNTNNQIGVPQNLLRLGPEHRVCVIEMGMNHRGEIEPLARTVEPDVALIVSIARCHLENLGSLEGVAEEKSNLYRFLKPGGTAVIPADYDQAPILERAAAGYRIVRAGRKGSMESEYLGGNIGGSSFLLRDKDAGREVRVEWTLSGAHQAANAAIAAAAAQALGVTLETIGRGLSHCVLPGLRMKQSEHLGATWLNDAYNANPDSMRATLSWLADFADPSKLLPVLGDMLETGEKAFEVHRETLEFTLEKFPGARILAVGPLMTRAADALGNKRIVTFPDSETCSAAVAEYVPKGGIVFLKASHGTHLEKVEPS